MKRLACFALALLMLVGLAACGAPASSSAPASQSTPPAESTSTAEPAGEVTWDSPELSWRQDTSPITYSLFMDIAWMPMDVWGSDHVSQKVTELTGVSFEVTKRQDENHLNMLMASGEYPDAIFVFTNKHKYETPEVSQPWNTLIDEYCPEFYQLIDESAITAATKDDGNFYTLYTHARDDAYWADPSLPVSYGEADLMFRDDIMEEIGNPEIKTVDDFYDALVAVKELHPDYTPYLRPKLNSEALMAWMGVDWRFCDFDVDGSDKLFMPIRERDTVENFLAFENKLIREGLMSVEGMTYDFEQQKQAVLAGKIFATAAQIYDVDQFNSELAATGNEGLFYTALSAPLTYNGANQYTPTYVNPGFAGLYITTACKEPGRLISLMEFMRSPEGDRLTQWGVEDQDYTLNADGLPIMNQDLEWKERGDNVWYFGASFMVEVQKAMVPADPNYSQVTNLMYDFKEYWDYNVYLGKAVPLPETTESEIKGAVKTLWDNNKDIIVTATSDDEFQTRLDTFYTDLERLDLDGYTAWAQEIYDNAKAQAVG